MKFNTSQNNTGGFIALIIVLIIAIISITTALSVSMSGLGELSGSFTSYQSNNSFNSADSCAEEALIRLRRNSNYAGGTIVLNNACAIKIDTIGSNRIITIQSTSTNAVHNIQAHVAIGSGGKITLTSWLETF